MRKNWARLFSVLLLVIGLGLLYLTNQGALSFSRPYIFRLSERLPTGNSVVAFKNVTVIPMDRERLIEDQTVLVQDGKIIALDNSGQISIPEKAQLVDGQGRYLMPGLVDMHVHLESENDLLLFIANGVTGVRNMWGNTDKKLMLGLPDQLTLQRWIHDGKLFGPTIYTTGPVMEGEPSFHPLAEVFPSAEAAAQSVTWQKNQGYDFIKVYDHLSPGAYQAIIETAAENDLPVVGHVPFAVGLDSVLSSGQVTIEHLTGYLDPDAVAWIIPEDQLDAYAAKTRDAGVWNCVTLSEYPKSKETPAGFELLQNQPGMMYVSPGTRLISPFLYFMAAQSHTYPGEDYPQRIAALNRRMVAALHDAGAGILLGTDAAQAYHLPGFAVHEELAMLVEAGLSPYEALLAGTRHAAEAMGKQDEFGTVAIGRRADLILLNTNPLSAVDHVKQRAGVMVQGRWLAEEELQTMLADLANSYRPSLVGRLWLLGILGFALYVWLRKANRMAEEN